MVERARNSDSGGSYTCYGLGEPLPYPDNTFDLCLSTWVVLELNTIEALNRFMCEIARVLRRGGTVFVVANTAEFYGHRWRTCEVDFPENRAPLSVGQVVKAKLLPENVIVNDIFWDDTTYRNALNQAEMDVTQVAHPLATDSAPGEWLDETRVAPWVIYEATRP